MASDQEYPDQLGPPCLGEDLYRRRHAAPVDHNDGRDRRTHRLMRYHCKSIVASVPPEAIVDAMQRAGFGEIECLTELDLFRAYRGRKL